MMHGTRIDYFIVAEDKKKNKNKEEEEKEEAGFLSICRISEMGDEKE